MASNVIKRFIPFVCAVSLVLGLVCASAAEDDASREIWVATVQDTINPIVSEYLLNILHRAETADAACMIIRLNTPGGVLETTRTIVQTILNAEIPVIVYVSPKGARAASAGMFITVAAHVAAMAPATNIGAAHPVSIGPGSIAPSRDKDGSDSGDSEDGTDSASDDAVMSQKVMNDTLAWARGIAEQRNRNQEWVRRAIEESISSTETEALESGVIDLISPSMPALIEQLHGRTVELPSGSTQIDIAGCEIVERPMNFRQKFLSVIINPTIAIYLLVAGLIGLYIELTHPGFILPGVIGGISMILALFSIHALPINYAGLFLILLAIAFFVAEVKVQSYGILTIGGVVGFILGASMLIDSDLPGMEVSMGAIIPLAIAVAAITLFLVSLVIRAHRSKPVTGESEMIGLQGVVSSDLHPGGQVFIHGEIWRAVTRDGSELVKGTPIRVVDATGLTLSVLPVNNSSKEDE